jgi:hypothetical protein
MTDGRRAAAALDGGPLTRRGLLRLALAAGATMLVPAAARPALAAPRAGGRRAAPSLRVLLLLDGDGGTDLLDGATLGAEEAGRAAALLGGSAALLVEREAASTAALLRRVRGEEVGAIVGRLDGPAGAALAGAPGVPFLDVGDADGAPPEARCARHVAHVAPTATMRLDAALLWLAGRDDAARWRLALPAGAAGERLRARARDRAPSLAATLLSGGEGLPRVALDDATTAAARVVAWHHTLERYGAAQLNDRFRARFSRPMPPAAWVGWMAVKIAWESAAGPRATRPPAERLAGPGARYDGHKGRPLDFRPWDHQLRQPLYVVEAATREAGGAAAESRVTTVPDGPGESTRVALDRLGATREESACGRGGTP